MKKLEFLSGDFQVFRDGENFDISFFDNGDWRGSTIRGLTKAELIQIRDQINEALGGTK